MTIVTPNSKANKVYTPEIVEYEWGVPPKRIPDLKALMGDRSDNIPGVPLVGPKTAVRWLTAYGSLENLLSKAHRKRKSRRRISRLTKRKHCCISTWQLSTAAYPRSVLAPGPP